MAARSHPPPPAGFDAPLVEAVLEHALAQPARPPVLGITGLQGSGKSTLARQLVQAGRRRGLAAVALSIDDFYLGRRERRALARRVHPLLAQRGPPGTHDPERAWATLDRLRALPSGESLRLPRFDKLADTRLPPSRWRLVRGPLDLIVFEGWFLGVPPQSVDELRVPVNALEREQDVDGRWRAWCNAALADYAPLWQRLDSLLWLRGPGFEKVRDWRWQQEQALQAARPRRQAMDRAQLDAFLQGFERIGRHAQHCLGDIADAVLALDGDRRPRDGLRKR
jgi:D-glycerate 3-kinase